MPMIVKTRLDTKAERERATAAAGQMHAVSYLLRLLHKVSLKHPGEMSHVERSLLQATREGRGADMWWQLRDEGKIR